MPAALLVLGALFSIDDISGFEVTKLVELVRRRARARARARRSARPWLRCPPRAPTKQMS